MKVWKFISFTWGTRAVNHFIRDGRKSLTCFNHRLMDIRRVYCAFSRYFSWICNQLRLLSTVWKSTLFRGRWVFSPLFFFKMFATIQIMWKSSFNRFVLFCMNCKILINTIDHYWRWKSKDVGWVKSIVFFYLWGDGQKRKMSKSTSFIALIFAIFCTASEGII